jgi:hypothetical protein
MDLYKTFKNNLYMRTRVLLIVWAIFSYTMALSQTQSQQDNVAFKVQVGAFKEQVPVELADVFIKIAHKDLNHYTDERGIKIYTLGNFKTYEEAAALKAELAKNYGMKDAFIVAFKNGKKVPVSEVKK